MPKLLARLLLLLVFTGLVQAQEPVTIRIDAAKTLGPVKPVWRFFGYDETNYTYMKNGRKLIGELSALSPTPVYIRTHHLLNTGDLKPALKWGSTNAYTEDASGKPVYNWEIVDKIFDTYLEAGAKPFVEIGFMPQALTTHPEPYRHDWPKVNSTESAYPPNNYRKWGDLIYELVKHAEQKYGRREAESWYWEVWNEPDIAYWKGTPEEYDKLYDFAADAVKRALPNARVGGPATTGPTSKHGADFLRQFLTHCDTGRNFETQKQGTPLDFITFHAKGKPELIEGHVRMGIGQNVQDTQSAFEIIAGFPKFHELPIVVSEADPEGCAACSAKDHPQNAYRNGTLYASYTASSFGHMLKAADRQQVNLEGLLTWAFEFEDQPYFAGFRSLATNGVDKPILNLFRMFGLMGGNRVPTQSSGSVSLNDLLAHGVRQTPDVDAIAARSRRSLTILVWNYHDDAVDGPATPVKLSFGSTADMSGHLLLEHYRIDESHSNSYSVWKHLGSPQDPSPAQYAELEAAGQLGLLESPKWITAKEEKYSVPFDLPRQSVSLLKLSW